MRYLRSQINELIALVLAALLLLQTLRSLSGIYYVVLAIVLLLFLSSPLSKDNVNKKNYSLIFAIYLSFLVYTGWVGVWSLIYNPNVSIISSVSRLFAITTLPLLLFKINNNSLNIEKFLNLYVLIYVLGAASYAYQLTFGPIEWFSDEPMERGSVFRFSTILGSGNVYGIGIGVALLSVSVLNIGIFLKTLVIISLLFGAIMSMQKATVVNLILWLAIYFFVFNRKHIIRSSLFLFSIILGLIFLAALDKENIISVYFQEFLFNSFGLNLFNNDSLVKSTVLDKENLIERFVGINLHEIFEMHGELILLTLGVGVTGAGGGMGLPEYPQAHSGYWDLVLMGGGIYFLLFVLLFCFANYRLLKEGTRLAKLLFYCNMIFAINVFSASIATFQPVIAFVFWLSIYYLSKKRC